MSWEKVREICFGCLHVDPDRFLQYRIADLWSMLRGWDDQVMFNLTVQKTMTKIISEVTNRSMGGNGVSDYIDAMIPLGDKEKKVEMTPERISHLLKIHNENMRRNREERERKKGLDNEKNKPI